MADSPIEPSLLSYIDEYVEEVDVNDAVTGRDLDPDDNLIVFYRELFSQLFVNELDVRITSISSNSAQRARALYRTKGKSWSEPLRGLVRSFQHFCKIYPDLLGEHYGEGTDAASELHIDLLPQLLRQLKRWAEQKGYAELEASVTASMATYEAFLEELDFVSA